MKIVIDITPEECKDLLIPGPNQITLYNEIFAAASKSWIETIGAMQKNVWAWKKEK